MKNASIQEIAIHIDKLLSVKPPGAKYQYRMAPPHRSGPELSRNPPEQAKKAAVMMLLYIKDNVLTMPMMQRPPDSGPHSSQISFPGGRYEPEDQDYWQTAVRETYEEFGVQPKSVTRLGALSQLYIDPSNFLVYPFVAYTAKIPDFVLDPVEVYKLIEFPVLEFLKPQNRNREIRDIRGMQIDVPYYRVKDHEIWGATAMMISELMSLISVIQDKTFNGHP